MGSGTLGASILGISYCELLPGHDVTGCKDLVGKGGKIEIVAAIRSAVMVHAGNYWRRASAGAWVTPVRSSGSRSRVGCRPSLTLGEGCMERRFAVFETGLEGVRGQDLVQALSVVGCPIVRRQA